VLDIESDAEPLVVFHAASGEPNVRVISVEGREMHRCEVDDRAHEIARS
jgi:hypothetical protein